MGVILTYWKTMLPLQHINWDIGSVIILMFESESNVTVWGYWAECVHMHFSFFQPWMTERCLRFCWSDIWACHIWHLPSCRLSPPQGRLFKGGGPGACMGGAGGMKSSRSVVGILEEKRETEILSMLAIKKINLEWSWNLAPFWWLYLSPWLLNR